MSRREGHLQGLCACTSSAAVRQGYCRGLPEGLAVPETNPIAITLGIVLADNLHAPSPNHQRGSRKLHSSHRTCFVDESTSQLAGVSQTTKRSALLPSSHKGR